MRFEKLVSLILLISLCAFTKAFSQTNSHLIISEAYDLIEEHENNPNFIILDVRTNAEYEVKHLEYGVNLDFYLSDFSEILDGLNINKTYLIYCGTGGRSVSAYNLMLEKGFENIYNMVGGIGAWESAGHEVTTEVMPILFSISDLYYEFNDLELNETDSVEITITNYGNDTLELTGFTDLEGTEYSTNFDVNTSLTGLEDYTFKIYYTPVDVQQDIINFQVESENEILSYEIRGNGTTVEIAERTKTELSIFPNPSRGALNINCNESLRLDLIDLKGQRIFSKQFTVGHSLIDLSEQNDGIYLVVITTASQSIIKKLVLE